MLQFQLTLGQSLSYTSIERKYLVQRYAGGTMEDSVSYKPIAR